MVIKSLDDTCAKPGVWTVKPLYENNRFFVFRAKTHILFHALATDVQKTYLNLTKGEKFWLTQKYQSSYMHTKYGVNSQSDVFGLASLDR